MSSVVIKLVRFLVLGFLPWLLISSTGNDPEHLPMVLRGTYAITVEGNSDYILTGDIRFSSERKVSSKGTFFSVLKLHFNGEKTEIVHNMEVVVCKMNKTDALPLGNYKVNTVESFLNPSNGVFGAFSSDSLGEKLFFTEKGSVRINHFCNTNVKGTLNMVLLNPKGEAINIKGDFDAR